MPPTRSGPRTIPGWRRHWHRRLRDAHRVGSYRPERRRSAGLRSAARRLPAVDADSCDVVRTVLRAHPSRWARMLPGSVSLTSTERYPPRGRAYRRSWSGYAISRPALEEPRWRPAALERGQAPGNQERLQTPRGSHRFKSLHELDYNLRVPPPWPARHNEEQRSAFLEQLRIGEPNPPSKCERSLQTSRVQR